MQEEPSAPERAGHGLQDESPFFIVGLPRSGTKLFRDVLRGHGRVRIPAVETNFLPRWADRWHEFGDLSDPARFAEFYRWNLRAPYFLYTSRHPRGVIGEQEWFTSCRAFTLPEVFEALLRRDADAPRGAGLHWGDKSPEYVNHLDLLGRLFPEARFVHMIRDARDYCLSLKRRNGASIDRAAQLWVDGVSKARADGRALGERYLELKYEDLITRPEEELRRSCAFLGLEFERDLLTLRFSTEHTGAAAGAREIVADNAGKYREQLTPAEVTRIERIAGPSLRELGYPVAYEGDPHRVRPASMHAYRVLDGIRHAWARGRRFGFLRHAQLQLGRLTRG